MDCRAFGDTCVPLERERLRDRLLAAGFREARIDTNPFSVRFRAELARK